MGKNKNYSNNSKANADVRDVRGDRKDYSRNRSGGKNKPARFIMESTNLHNIRRDHNDSEWYKDDRGIVSESARYGNYQPTGRPWLRRGFTAITAQEQEVYNFAVPSALICQYVPAPGISTNPTSAMSIAGQQMFQVIRRSLNKVLTGYQFADPMIAYAAGFTSLVILAREMIRDYKIANSWSSDNFSYPYGILHALGYSEAAARNLIQNMADYRARFNTLMYQASSIFIPFETNQLKKYIWMADGLWGDKDNPKAQVYGYMASGYYSFEEGTNPDDPGSWGKYHRFDWNDKIAKNKLFEDKLNNFEQCLTKLRNSDSFNYMMSDLRTAFQDVQGYVFDSLIESDSISIDYNDIMLRQFQNIRTLPPIARLNDTEWFNIRQSVEQNSIYLNPNNIPLSINDVPKAQLNVALESMEHMYFPKSFIMNWSSSAPSEDEVIENTNGAVMWHWDQGNETLTIGEGDMSCYIPLNFVMTFKDYDDTWNEEIFTSWNFRHNDQTGILDNLWQISMFDWFPIIYDVVITFNQDQSTREIIISPFVEDDVLAPITQHQLRSINKAEQYALWKVANTANF